MPKGKIGNIKKVGVDGEGLDIFRVQVEAGTRQARKVKTATVHGTIRDAQAAAAMLYVGLKDPRSSREIPDVTLDQYFYGRFLPALQAEGKTKSTLDGYLKNFEKWISPAHGGTVLERLEEGDVRRLIEESGSPRNTLRTYRAVLNRAKAEGFMSHKMDLAGTKAKTTRQVRHTPWSPQELKKALVELRDDEMAYLTLLMGSAGLRKEENLAITPADVRVLNLRNGRRYALLNVHAAYTDEDGLKATKTEESPNRYSLVLPEFTEDFLAALEATKPELEEVDGCWLIRYKTGWHRARSAKYRVETVLGGRNEAEAARDRLAEETSRRYRFGSAPRMKEVAGGIWTITVFDGYRDSMERTVVPEAFIGTEEEARAHALERWAGERVLCCSSDTLRGHWKTALKNHGLRYIPTNNLRHTSESLMAASGVATPTISNMHGHTRFSTDFEHYIDLNVEAILEAAGKVDAYMASDMANGGFSIEPFAGNAGTEKRPGCV